MILLPSWFIQSCYWENQRWEHFPGHGLRDEIFGNGAATGWSGAEAAIQLRWFRINYDSFWTLSNHDASDQDAKSTVTAPLQSLLCHFGVDCDSMVWAIPAVQEFFGMQPQKTVCFCGPCRGVFLSCLGLGIALWLASLAIKMLKPTSVKCKMLKFSRLGRSPPSLVGRVQGLLALWLWARAPPWVLLVRRSCWGGFFDPRQTRTKQFEEILHHIFQQRSGAVASVLGL